MKFISTRGGVSPLSFQEAVLCGLADDEGLLVPETVPDASVHLSKWENLSFAELTFEVMKLYVLEEDVPYTDLKSMINKSMASFEHPDVTPVVSVNDIHILELFHGPTFSFKDVALQFLGNLFEYILDKRSSKLTVVGATSGDTGSAAIHGLKGKKNVEVFILYPKGRVSHIQELQMTSVLDSNIHCLSLSGTFDDCQTIVKKLFADLDFKKKHHLGAINSINWSRIMSQIVYYFFAYFQLKKKYGNIKVVFSVPTGNFGDIVAGYYAKRMGLPIHRLVVSTNANDILDRFFSKGEYHKADHVTSTCTPSMDIQIASNFERYLYYLSGENPTQVKQWMSNFAATGKLTVSGALLAKAQEDFQSCAVQQAEVCGVISSYYRNHKYIMDPHTAVGIKGVSNIIQRGDLPLEPTTKVVCLSTAHPAKFGETVNCCIGEGYNAVTEFKGTLELLKKEGNTRCSPIDASVDAVKSVVESTCC